MAGMDWLRWHHGSITDPKFQLVAKKSGCTVAEVIAFWVFVLEAASQADDRGSVDNLDFESIECLLGLGEGKGSLIHSAMKARGLIGDDMRITAWEKRQPKREREDDSAGRVRAYRKRQEEEANNNVAQVTPCNAGAAQEKPRVEESRGESKPSISESSVISAPEANPPQNTENATRKGELCKKIRALGFQAAPHFTVWADILPCYSDDEILAAAEIAREKKPGERLHLNYILPMLKDKGGTTRRVDNAQPPWFSSDVMIIKEGERIGIKPRPGESMSEFKGRVGVKRVEFAQSEAAA